MSAERLREAAALMRERAERIAEGPWEAEPMRRGGEALEVICPEGNDVWGRVADAESEFDAIHIASWHPAVALAVADWLEVFAECVADDPGMSSKYAAEMDSALAVADAYLGPERT